MELGCFGKLPIHADFIRYRPFGMEISAFDQLLQEGIHAAQTRLGKGAAWETAYATMHRWNFVFCPPGGKKFLVGVVTPSQDKAGRRYPFIVYYLADRNLISPALAPHLLAPFLKEASKIASEGWGGLSLKQFLDYLPEQERLLSPNLVSPDTEKEYFRFLQSETFDHPDRKNMGCNLSLMIRPTANPAILCGLKLPLKETLSIPFWYDLIGRLRKNKIADPTFFWADALVAFSGLPSPKGLLSLFGVAGDGWFDLMSPVKDEAVDSLFQDQGLSLSQILEKM